MNAVSICVWSLNALVAGAWATGILDLNVLYSKFSSRPEGSDPPTPARNRTDLMSAAMEGRLEDVNSLLAHNDIEVNSQDAYGWTALMFAARYGCHEVLAALLERREINVNLATYEHAWSAVMLAAHANQCKNVTLLLARHDVVFGMQERDAVTRTM
jgi:ankyrin repeat protein